MYTYTQGRAVGDVRKGPDHPEGEQLYLGDFRTSQQEQSRSEIS